MNTKALKIAKDNADKGSKMIRALIMVAGIEISDKDVTAILKEVGVAKSSSGLTPVTINAFLEDGKTERELYELVLDAMSVNSARWITTHNKTRILVNKVYAKFGNDVSEDAAGDVLKDAVAALVPKSK